MSSDTKVPYRLLTNAELNRVSRRKLWIMFWGWLACAIHGIGLALLLDWLARHWPANSPQFNRLAAVIAILFLIAVGVTLGFAYLKYKAAKLVCPNCHANITKWTMQIVSTRCCCMCWHRILEGGQIKTYEEYQQHWSKLDQGLYPFRIMSLVYLGLLFWFAPMFSQHPIILVILGGLIGCQQAAQLYRSRNRRDLIMLIGCCCLIGLGIGLHFADMH